MYIPQPESFRKSRTPSAPVADWCADSSHSTINCRTDRDNHGDHAHLDTSDNISATL
jgi:hypothetical protein